MSNKEMLYINELSYQLCRNNLSKILKTPIDHTSLAIEQLKTERKKSNLINLDRIK